MIIDKLLSFFDILLPNKFKGITAFLYHSVSYEPSPLSVGAKEFEEQMRFLSKNGYKSILPDQINGALKESWKGKTVLICFDDGFKDNLIHAFPILNKYNFQATVFVATDYIGKQSSFCTSDQDKSREMLNRDDIHELEESGWCVANHFKTHTNLTERNLIHMMDEYVSAKLTLQEILVRKENAEIVAYPRNRHTALIRKTLANKGVKMGFAGKKNQIIFSSDIMQLPRAEVGQKENLWRFAAFLHPSYYIIRHLFLGLKNAVRTLLKSRWTWFALSLLLIRILTLALAANDIPYTAAKEQQLNWWVGLEGDSLGYFNDAYHLQNFEFLPGLGPIGYPLMITPIVALSGAQELADIAVILVGINTIIIYAIAVLLVYALGLIILGDKLKAVIVSGIFLIYPYVFYALFAPIVVSHDNLQLFLVTRFKQLQFFSVLSDPLSMILMLGTLLLFVYIIRKNVFNHMLLISIGAIASWAAVTRIQNALIIPLIAILIWIYSKFKYALVFTVATLPLICLQLYANYAGNGSPFATTYRLQKGTDLSIPMISPEYPLRILSYPMKYSPTLFIPMIIILTILIVGILKYFKHNKKLAAIIISYLIANSLLILFLEPTLRNPRYFLPVIPIILIMGYLGIETIYKQTYQLWKKKNLNLA